MPTVRRPKGFTLIELLVVIAIIALLMSILMPALARVKKQAQSVKCQAALKQWGYVFAMYGNDFNSKIRTTGRDGYWLVISRPYLNVVAKGGEADRYELYFCPMAMKTTGEGASLGRAAYRYDYDGITYTTSYGFNAWVYDPPQLDMYQDRPGGYMWRTLDVKGANTIPVLTSCFHGGGCPHHTDMPPQYDGEPWAGGHNNEMKRFALNRHDGFANTLFMDWSTARVGLKEFWTLKWHREYQVAGPWTRAGGVLPSDWPQWLQRFKDY
jgi:prepilin-type N-terminal cleavage/methylation domain-containing protein/prepilin-type processing-associated H-X9-DG protein